MSAHTPGPWFAEPPTANKKTWHVVAPCGLRLAWRIESPNEAQDARLIAAAPELLASLSEIVRKSHLRPGKHEDCHVHPDLIARARAVLASVQQSA